MGWVKLDDQFHGHPKPNAAYAACPAALGLHMLAMSYSQCFGLDGFVDDVFVAGKLANAALRRKAIQALEAARMWHRVSDGWMIHDWAEYNGDASTRDAARQAKAEAGRKGGLARARNASNGQAPASDLLSTSQAGSQAGAKQSARRLLQAPNPNPLSAKADRERARVRFNGKVVPEDRLEAAEAILEDFNEREGTAYKPFGAGGKPTEPFKRLLGALVERPHVAGELGCRVNEICLGSDRFWDGVAQPGNVWGPNVVDRNISRALGAKPKRSDSDNWLGTSA